MRTAVTCVLAVHERCYVLAVAVAVCEHDLDILSHKMDRLVEGGLRHVVLDQVEKTVLGLVCSAVEIECQALLEVGVVLHHGFDEFHAEAVSYEQVLVRNELHQSSVLLLCLLLSRIYKLSFAEFCI